MSEHSFSVQGTRRASYVEATTTEATFSSPVLFDLSTLSLPTDGVVKNFSASTESMRFTRRNAAADLSQIIAECHTTSKERRMRLGDKQGGMTNLDIGGSLSIAQWQMNPQHPFANTESSIAHSSSRSTAVQEWGSRASEASFDNAGFLVEAKNLDELSHLASQICEHDPRKIEQIQTVIRKYTTDKDVRLAANGTITEIDMQRLAKKYVKDSALESSKGLLILAALFANPAVNDDIKGNIIHIIFPQNEDGCAYRESLSDPTEKALENFIIGMLFEQNYRRSSNY